MNNTVLDKSIPVPLYYQLKEKLLSDIKNGDYKLGDAIPTEKDLSSMFVISRTTVRQAINELVQEGWLYREKSKGTFVTKPKINQSFVQALGSFNEQMEKLGKRPSTQLLELKVISVPDCVLNKLNLNKNDKVIYMHRKRYADEIPIVMVETFLPYNKCQFILDYDLENFSLYPLLRNYEKTEIHKIHRYIEAVIAEDYDVDNLNISVNNAIQLFTSIAYSAYEEPIEYSIARYRGDQNVFEVTITN